MKNLFFKSVLFLGLASSIVACSDEETPAPSPSLVGKWNVNSEVVKAKLGTNELQNDSTAYAAGEATVEFIAPKTVIAKFGTDLDTSDYFYANGKLTLIAYDAVNGNDTTIFNKVNLTTNSLLVSLLDTQSTPSGNLYSEYTLRLSK